MKKTFSRILSAALALLLTLSLTGCAQSKGISIAIPNDTTNEARALLLLEDLGYIKLKEGAGITATPLDIAENPHGIQFKEVEAAQIPNILPDVDFAVINSNYAIEAKLNPTKDALGLEGSSSAYSNILAVKEGNENSDLIKALKAALESQQVADLIAEQYDGAVVSVVDNPGDGYDPEVDYGALAGQTVSVAASPTPPRGDFGSGEIHPGRKGHHFGDQRIYRLHPAQQRGGKRRDRRQLLPACSLSGRL